MTREPGSILKVSCVALIAFFISCGSVFAHPLLGEWLKVKGGGKDIGKRIYRFTDRVLIISDGEGEELRCRYRIKKLEDDQYGITLTDEDSFAPADAPPGTIVFSSEKLVVVKEKGLIEIYRCMGKFSPIPKQTPDTLRKIER